MGLSVRNSFVLLSKIEEETPAFKDYVIFSQTRYRNVLRKQLYLQKHGVSFSYTDGLTYKQIEDLISECQSIDEEASKQI